MRKKIYLLLLLFAVFGFLKAQTEYYYYYKGQKKYLTLDKKSFYLFTNTNFDTSSTASLGVEDYAVMVDNVSENTKFAHLKLIIEPNNDTAYYQKLNALKQLPNVENVGIFFKNGDFDPVGISKYFYVKLKNINDYIILQQVALQKNANIVKQIPNMSKWYVMAVSNGNNITSLELGNQFYETGLFDTVDPAFMLNFSIDPDIDDPDTSNRIPNDNGNYNDVTCSYDPDFYRLWGLKNNTNSAVDINACQAWQISQGANIYVAVVDQGIYFPHLDLSANIGSAGYDAQSGNSGSVYITGNTHGTKVAGVIAAVRNNNLQVVGVAPKSKIIPISHDLYNGTVPNVTTSTISEQLASGISWAWQYEMADVINNSWGVSGIGTGASLYSALLEDSLIDAMTQGRDGKGCIVVFSSGNILVNNPAVLYPGNFDDRIITVGAITKTGSRWSKSTYGSKLDVVAPGEGIWLTTPPNAIIESSGTSFAAPHVSGIAALILSVNPCLMGQQVRDIIEKTSQKVGNYSYITTAGRSNGTWNNEMGYGLVDAYASVLMAKSMLSSNPCPEGFQENTEIEAVSKRGTLEIIAPNPASNSISVTYKLSDANSVSLMIVSQIGNNIMNTYNLDANTTQTNINISNYLTGLYTVALVVNGEVVDAKTLIKQ